MAIERIDLNDPEWGFTFSSCVIAGDFVFTAHHGGYDVGEASGRRASRPRQSSASGT
jgi:hypothetical protein